MILDTNFVIAAEREARRRIYGPAHAFSASHSTEILYINFTVAGELACGRTANARHNWELLCRRYPLLPWSMEIAWHYGELYRALSAVGQLIGSNDLWIAATALVHKMSVVTANRAEFERVPGLAVTTF